jgi:pyrroline-5-carboxylate reductase
MALDNERIAVIGCGVMGEAMVKGLLHERLVRPDQIVVSHPREERCRDIGERYGVRTTTGNRAAAEGATMVVMAIKPQFFDEVAAELKGAVLDRALVVTIVAGVRMAHAVEVLDATRVARVMPNTPGQIGRGISVWTATDAVNDEDRQRVRALLSALGVEEWVRHENELDMATALSGTGPAYVFLFMEALIDAGVHLGFSRRLASKLVFETVRGSVEYAAGNTLHPAELRNQVTSPGGTSAEAQAQLERGRLRTVLSDAVWAAYRRCVQLGELAQAKGGGHRQVPAAAPSDD